MSRLPVTLLMSVLTAAGITCGQKKAAVFPVDIALVKEMSFIPEVDAWPPCTTGAFTRDSLAAANEWKTLHAWVEKRFSAKSVRMLSNWAQKQMKDYSSTPHLDRFAFSPSRIDQGRRHLLLCAAIDTLPTHEKVVSRYLTLYLLFDRQEQKIRRVTITIRGDARE